MATNLLDIRKAKVLGNAERIKQRIQNHYVVEDHALLGAALACARGKYSAAQLERAAITILGRRVAPAAWYALAASQFMKDDPAGFSSLEHMVEEAPKSPDVPYKRYFGVFGLGLIVGIPKIPLDHEDAPRCIGALAQYTLENSPDCPFGQKYILTLQTHLGASEFELRKLISGAQKSI